MNFGSKINSPTSFCKLQCAAVQFWQMWVPQKLLYDVQLSCSCSDILCFHGRTQTYADEEPNPQACPCTFQLLPPALLKTLPVDSVGCEYLLMTHALIVKVESFQYEVVTHAQSSCIGCGRVEQKSIDVGSLKLPSTIYLAKFYVLQQI